MRRGAAALFALTLAGCVGAPDATVAGPAAPVELRCEGLAGAPFTGTAPRLSWRLPAGARGADPAAWQILVATRPERLLPGQADRWDSGRVEAGRAAAQAYAGQPLEVDEQVYWTVRVWDAEGRPSPWSAPATWSRAPVQPSEWGGARWIDDGRPVPGTAEALYAEDPAPLLRHEFHLEQPVVRATLHLAGLGWCAPRLNGRAVGDLALDPPWTDFEERILFSSHEVTELLQPGANCLGLELGKGWYQPLPLRMWGHLDLRASLPTGRPRAVARLVVEHADGSRTSVVTGPDWQTAGGPRLRDNVYLGVEHDARLEQPGWSRPGFDASAWGAARVTAHPLDPLQPRVTPPVRAAAPVPAVAVSSPEPGVHLVDFGRNFTGLAELDLDLPAGTRLVLRYGELLDAQGRLNPMTSVCGQIKGTRKTEDGDEVSVGGPGAPTVAWQQDVYTAAGGPVTWRPAFTFHGFRYLEIRGLESAPALETVRGIPLHSDVAPAGEFACSDELLNRIQALCRGTFLSNLVSVQSDCPHRERFAYGGDIVATSEALLANFDMSGFYAKTVRDWADAAREDGRFTDTAPFVGIDYCGIGWAMVHPLLLEQLYRQHGDRRLLEEQLPVALRWLATEAAARQDGLVVKGLGDHEALDRAGGPALLTPMFVDTARRLARLARVLDRPEDAARCARWAEESARAWEAAFLDPVTGGVGGGTQSELACALGFDVVPDALRPRTLARLVEALDTPEGPRLRTGIFGTRFLLEELCRGGRADLALALARGEQFPSWGWMLENGATTLWEHWAGSDNTFSHNHPMFGSVSAWFFRRLGGIQPAVDAVGFDRIVIRPEAPAGLDWVESAHRTTRGRVGSSWRRTADGVEFEVEVPPTARAVVELPAGPGAEVLESGRAAAASPGVEVLPPTEERQRFRVASGSYRFLVRPRPAAAARPAAARPNLLFLFADDQRHDTLGSAGHPQLQTPNLDALAARGVRFSNAFVNHSICWVSRASVLSGLHARSLGSPEEPDRLLPDRMPLLYPPLLREAGYRTGHFGKFHARLPAGRRPAELFDEFVSIHRAPYFHEQPDGSRRHTTDLIADHAVAFLRSQPAGQPFALNLWFNAGHAEDGDHRPGHGHYPWPAAVDGLYDGLELPPPPLGDPAVFAAQPGYLRDSIHRERWHWRWDTPEKYQANLRAYLRMISGIDHAVARVLAALEQEGLADDTIVVYSADNGYYLGDRGFAGKWSHYEQSLRVPLIVFDPRPQADATRGRVEERWAMNLDLPASFLGWAGVPMPAAYQGRDLAPVVEGRAPAEWREEMFLEHLVLRPRISWEGVRAGDLKYARYFDQTEDAEFLHDLRADPDELVNLARDPARAADLERLRRRTDALVGRYGAPLPGSRFAPPAADR